MNTLTTEHTPDNIIASWLDDHQEELVNTADYIFHHPELAYQETLSSKCLADYLESQGFKITWKTAGIDTAFTAVWGGGKTNPRIPGRVRCSGRCRTRLRAQPAWNSRCRSGMCIKSRYGSNRCSRNDLRLWLPRPKEIMSGKIVMNDQGVFDDLDVAITWHPFDRNRVSNDIWQAQDIKNYTFHGLSSHAAKAPEKGRSALDAAELMNVGVNYLREHVPGDVRMHYAYIDNGLPANVVPDIAKTNYFIRSYLRSRTEDASERVDNCARGAALMTDTTVDIELVASCSEMKVNRVLTELYYDAMTRVPTPAYTPEELDFAKQIIEEAGLINDGTLFSGLEPLEDEPVPIAIGTDASQVSHTVPLITLSAATMCKGTPLHHWAAARQAGMTIGQKGMFYVARCMAEGTKLLMETPGSIEKAWELHKLTP